MNTTQSKMSGLALISRLYWMVFGPLILIIPGYLIIEKGNGWLTPVDFAFLIVLAALPIARWLEFRGGNPMTSTGEQATSSHLRRYASCVLVFGLGAWVIANVIGNHWLTR